MITQVLPAWLWDYNLLIRPELGSLPALWLSQPVSSVVHLKLHLYLHSRVQCSAVQCSAVQCRSVYVQDLWPMWPDQWSTAPGLGHHCQGCLWGQVRRDIHLTSPHLISPHLISPHLKIKLAAKLLNVGLNYINLKDWELTLWSSDCC